MYAILTSKPGQYHATFGVGATAVESYEYLFYGRCKAIFDVIQLDRDIRVTITEDTPPYISNSVPSKFLEKFDTLEQARASLEELIAFGNLDAQLKRREVPAAVDQ
jgi:hypothetical protein